jgi:hypothetical protein
MSTCVFDGRTKSEHSPDEYFDDGTAQEEYDIVCECGHRDDWHDSCGECASTGACILRGCDCGEWRYVDNDSDSTNG